MIAAFKMVLSGKYRMLFKANRSHLEAEGLIRKTIIQRIKVDDGHIVELLCPQFEHCFALTLSGLKKIQGVRKS